jgi:tRNA(Ile)-lysidine synthase
VLLRLVRGAGRRGLGGIRPRRGRIVRPLILCDRVQVRYFLVDRGLTWRVDRSNFDLRFARARVRFGFLPALTRELNPRLPRALARLADVVREEDALLDGLTRAALSDAAALESAILTALDPPLARRAVLRWWRRHGSGRRLGQVHVAAILALAGREGSATSRVPGGAVVRDGAQLRFVVGDGRERAAEPYALALGRDQTVATPGGWHLSAIVADRARAPVADAMTCLADADALPEILTVRSRRPGDRMRPLGLGGTTTLKRLLIARKVPRAARDLWPVVVAGEDVLWVPGCARGEHARVSDVTRKVIVVRAEKRV